MPSMPTAQRGITVRRSRYVVTPVETIPEADSLSFLAGDLIIATTAQGTVYIADSNAQIYGIALRAGNNDTDNDELAVTPFIPGIIYRMPISAANSEATQVSATTHVGVRYGINQDDSGFGFVNVSDTINTRCRVLRLLDAAGTIAGFAEVEPI